MWSEEYICFSCTVTGLGVVIYSDMKKNMKSIPYRLGAWKMNYNDVPSIKRNNLINISSVIIAKWHNKSSNCAKQQNTNTRRNICSFERRKIRENSLRVTDRRDYCKLLIGKTNTTRKKDPWYSQWNNKILLRYKLPEFNLNRKELTVLLNDIILILNTEDFMKKTINLY